MVDRTLKSNYYYYYQFLQCESGGVHKLQGTAQADRQLDG